MNAIRQRRSTFVALGVLAFALYGAGASAQHAMHAGHAQHSSSSATPVLAGQDAFGAIQEVVRLLESDPSTDWSKVNISALRNHLIDMHEVTLNAVAAERSLENGLEINVTGLGRTREAIQRMVPAHALELKSLGWAAKTEMLPDGVKMIVTSTERNQALKLKALGFAGIMVQGSHHQQHHLMMARGQFEH